MLRGSVLSSTILLQYAHHWSDVLIQSSNWEPMQAFRQPRTIAFPLLERIALWGIDPSRLKLSLTREQVPALKALVISSFTLHTWSLPWSQLHSLYVLDYEANPEYFLHVMKVLPQCTQLRELRFQTSWSDDDDLSDFLSEYLPAARVVELPNLIYLSISTYNETILDTLLTSLSAPILAEFFVDHWENDDAFASVISFLVRHAGTIKTLALGTNAELFYDIGTIPNSFPRLWGLLPNLQRLRLHH